MVLLFLLGLILNFGILLISMTRLITFLVDNIKLRLVAFSLLLPLTILFTNECVQIMANPWGATAYLYTRKLIQIDNLNFNEFF